MNRALRNCSLILSHKIKNQSIASYSSNVEVDDDVTNSLRRVYLNNERQRNSLGIEMIRSLQSSIDSLDLNKCRTLVISSKSNKIFSSGI